MKNYLLMIPVLVFGIIGCSSSEKYSSLEKMDTIEEDKVLGDSLPSWVRESGIRDGEVIMVGKAEYSADKNEDYVSRAAKMDAEMLLFNDAPADVRIVAQKALAGAGVDSGEFYEIQTSLKEIIGVHGVKTSPDRVTCRKVIHYGETQKRLFRKCWSEARISLIQLKKAYEHTLKVKYGIGVAKSFAEKMDVELEKTESLKRKISSDN